MNTLWQLLTQVRRVFVWWVVVQPWEQAIRVRLGRAVVRLGPGAHFRIPFADTIYRQSVRMRWSELPVQTLTTVDGATVTISAAFGYRVEDIERLYQTLHHAEGTLRNMAMSAIAAAVQSSEQARCTPDAVVDDAERRLDLEPHGIGGVTVRITDFAFVRTYRLIQDQRWVSGGDNLDTATPSPDGTSR